MLKHQENRSIEQQQQRFSSQLHHFNDSLANNNNYRIRKTSKENIASQHAWMMMLLPRHRMTQTTTATISKTKNRRERQQKQLGRHPHEPSSSLLSPKHHPDTQLLKSISPFEERTPFKGTSQSNMNQIDIQSNSRTRTATATIGPQVHTVSHKTFAGELRDITFQARQPVRTSDPSPVDPFTPRRRHCPIRFPTALTPPLLGNIPPVPHEIVFAVGTKDTTRCSRNNSPAITPMIDSTESTFTTGETTATTTKSQVSCDNKHSIDDDDIYSEVSLDFEILAGQAQGQSFSEARSEVQLTKNHNDYDDGCDHHYYFDHPLFQELGNLSSSLLLLSDSATTARPFPLNHNSVTTHNSVWGITTTTLDEPSSDDDWPSDEDERAKPPPYYSKTARRRHTVCGNSCRPSKTTMTHPNKPSSRRHRSYSSNSNLQKCSSAGNHLYDSPQPQPLFEIYGKENPQSSITTTTALSTTTASTTPVSRDDEVTRCQSTTRVTYNDFLLPRSRTSTTESSSSATITMRTPPAPQ